MRGGLGRTLLTAFLLLTIIPLSLISLLAVTRSNQVRVEQEQVQLTLLLESYAAQIEQAIAATQAALQGGAAAEWRWLAGERPVAPPAWVDSTRDPAQWQVGGDPPALWVAAERPDGWAARPIPLAPLLARPARTEALAATHFFIQREGELLPLGQYPTPPALNGSAPGTIVARVPLATHGELIGVSPLDPTTQSAGLAATLIGAAIMAALLSSIVAAIVTRRITQPLYALTRSAAQLARGDLHQRVTISQENELGVLALAFNTMASQLQETLHTLEDRVAQRTEALSRANENIRERAQLSQGVAETGTALGQMKELEPLLHDGTHLIAATFQLEPVELWLLGRRRNSPPGLARRAATSPDSLPEIPALTRRCAAEVVPQRSDDSTLLALPLRVAGNALGCLVVGRQRGFVDEDLPALQGLADSFAVAIENARAVELEREALYKLRQIEGRRVTALGEMSHELSTALNSIIGFSQLMLKGVDGPLTEVQRSDLTYINRNGTHLLTLLDGLLEMLDAPAEPAVKRAPPTTSPTDRR